MMSLVHDVTCECSLKCLSTPEVIYVLPEFLQQLVTVAPFSLHPQASLLLVETLVTILFFATSIAKELQLELNHKKISLNRGLSQ